MSTRIESRSLRSIGAVWGATALLVLAAPLPLTAEPKWIYPGPINPETADPEALVDHCHKIESTHPEQSVALARQALGRIDPQLNPHLAARAHGCKAWALGQLGHEDSATETILSMASLAEAIPELEIQSDLFRRAGAVAHNLGQTIATLEYYERALSVAEEAGLEDRRTSLIVNLGAVLAEGENLESALEYLRKGLRQFEQAEDSAGALVARYNLAQTYSELERYREALDQAMNLLPAVRQIGHPGQLLDVKLLLTYLHFQLGDLASAWLTLSQAEALVDEMDHPGRQAVARIRRAQLEVESGYPDPALANALQAIDIAREAGRTRALIAGLGTLSDIHRMRGDYRQALEVFEEYHEVRADRLRSQNLERMVELESWLRDQRTVRALTTAHQENELQRLRAERQETRMRYLGASTAALVLLALAALLWQRSANRRLRAISLTDPLTGLPNRRRLAEALRRLPVPSIDERRPAVLILDLDDFKRINDNHGHDAGDRVLQQVAERIRSACRQGDLVGRWGGEEFVVIATPLTLDGARSLAERLLADISRTAFDLGTGEQARLTTSVGFAPWPISPLEGTGPDRSWERVLSLADWALYQAKSTGNTWAGLWPDKDSEFEQEPGSPLGPRVLRPDSDSDGPDRH